MRFLYVVNLCFSVKWGFVQLAWLLGTSLLDADMATHTEWSLHQLAALFSPSTSPNTTILQVVFIAPFLLGRIAAPRAQSVLWAISGVTIVLSKAPFASYAKKALTRSQLRATAG